jgi:hypothetical protein
MIFLLHVLTLDKTSTSRSFTDTGSGTAGCSIEQSQFTDNNWVFIHSGTFELLKMEII